MFGGKKDTIMTTGQAIRNLRETEDMLLKKQEYLEKKINQEIEIAKQNGSKNKRGIYEWFVKDFRTFKCTKIEMEYCPFKEIFHCN